MNRQLRAAAAYTVMGRKHLAGTWLQSEDNPGDDPSRGVPLRSCSDCPSLPEHLVRPRLPSLAVAVAFFAAGCPASSGDPVSAEILEYLWRETPRVSGHGWGRELGSTAGDLTAALESVGVPCRPPILDRPGSRRVCASCVFDHDQWFIELLTEVVAGYYGFLHIRAPSTGWSILSHLHGGSRSRKCPDGTRPLTFLEDRSLTRADRICLLRFLLHRRGGLFCVEHPAESLMFGSSPFSLLIREIPTWTTVLDQCAYGLRPTAADGPEHIRKRTRLMGNFQGLEKIERRCPGVSLAHTHVFALRGGRTKKGDASPGASVAILASQYPTELCAQIAGCVADACLSRDGRGRQQSGN